MKGPITFASININTPEGRYLMAAIAKITTESQTDKTPDQVMDQLHELQEKMYKDEEEIDPFEAVVRPVMKYLAENHHPHTAICVESNQAEMVEGIRSLKTDEYLVD